MFVIEVLDLLQDGPFNYFSSGWNWIDLFGAISFFAYLYIKIHHIIKDKYSVDVSFENQKKLLLCFVIFMMVCKVNFYLRIYPKLGQLTMLVKTCIIDIIPFAFYLMIWLVVMTLMYKILEFESTGY